METRANYVAVGLFTIAAIISAFVLIYWFGRFDTADELVPLDVRIEGSVSGLGPGSVVQFNGIDIGTVEGLSLDEDPRYVIVRTRVNRNTPIRTDTQASIGVRGLSGGAFIQLKGGTPTAQNLIGTNVAPDDPRPTIQGSTAGLDDLMERAGKVAISAEETMATLQQLVESNSSVLTQTIRNSEKFSAALAQNSDSIGTFMTSAGNVADSLAGLSVKLDGAVRRAEEILNAVEPRSVRTSLDNIETFTNTMAAQQESIDKLVGSVEETAQRLSVFSSQLNGTLTKVDGLVGSVSPETVRETMASIGSTAKRLDTLTGAVDEEQVAKIVSDLSQSAASARETLGNIDPESIGRIVFSVRDLTEKLSTISTDLDGTLKKVDAIVTAIPAETVGTAVASIESTATKAGEVLATIDSAKVGQAVDDLAQTAADAKGVMSGINQDAVRELVDNLSVASRNVTTVLAALDAERINTAVENISNAAKGANEAVTDVRKVTQPIGAQAETFKKMIEDASEMVTQLRASSTRVDEVIDQAKTLLGSEGAQRLTAEVSQTLAAFRSVADSLERNVAAVSAGLTDFTKRGLGDTQGLIQDARQSIRNVDRVIRRLGDNPSSLITGSGGSRVRETNQRQRR